VASLHRTASNPVSLRACVTHWTRLHRRIGFEAMVMGRQPARRCLRDITQNQDLECLTPYRAPALTDAVAQGMQRGWLQAKSSFRNVFEQQESESCATIFWNRPEGESPRHTRPGTGRLPTPQVQKAGRNGCKSTSHNLERYATLRASGSSPGRIDARD
jgi:hypothetical protein